MTRTSTEGGRGRGTTGGAATPDPFASDPVFLTEQDAREAGARWRTRWVAVVTVLAVVCAAFVGLTYFQGPKAGETQVDTTAVVERPGQQLRVFANQALAHVDASQVVVTPAAAFTVQTSGDVVAVTFTGRLAYDTDYHVRVDGVSSVYQRQTSTLEARFSTPPATAYRLVRGTSGADDRIERAGLRGSDRTTVWSAPRIQAYEVFDSAVAVVTDDGTQSSLSLVSLDGAAVETLPVPEAPGLITRFAADRATTTLAFSFRPTGSDVETLYTLPLQGERAVAPVLGLSGQPVEPTDWAFVPGEDDVVVQAVDDSVSVIDLSGVDPVRPVGTYSLLQGVSLDGTTLIAASAIASMVVDLATGDERPRAPAPVDGVLPFAGPLVALDPGHVVQQVSVPSDDGLTYRTLVVADDGATSRTLWQPPSASGVIEGFDVSPNGQYLAVQSVGDATTPTDYSYTIDPVADGVTTTIVEIASGAVVASYEGFDTSW